MPKHAAFAGLLTLCMGIFGGEPAHADVQLPALFSDHAVLQESARTPIWGKAAPGEAVSVLFGGTAASATADGEGRWRVDLDLRGKAPGPYELTVKGTNTVTVSDVLVGEVWLCSGQSNMEFPLKETTGAAKEIAGSADPRLRQFLVEKSAARYPADEARGAWTSAGPAASGEFSAVAYYFGKDLRRDLGRPVGLVNSSWGNTPLEAWISSEGLDGEPGLKAGKDGKLADVDAFPGRIRGYQAALTKWMEKYGRQDKPSGDPGKFAAVEISTDGWKPLTLPGRIAAAGLPDAGSVWLRKAMTVSPAMEGLYAFYEGGVIDGFYAAYWNGKKILEATPESGKIGRIKIPIPGEMIHAGPAVLAIRIFNPRGGLGVAVDKTPFVIGSLPLAGEWLAREELALPPLDEKAQGEYPAAPDVLPEKKMTATYLFNGMIRPLIPYALRGAVWYQGESNVGRAFQYRKAFPLLIGDWRGRWGNPDLPFYFCQLANFGAKPVKPDWSGWAELRESQSMALALPHTGEAVLIDAGEDADVHFRDKRIAGDRLARIALAQTYGRNENFSGPVCASMKVEGSMVRLSFLHTEGGLTAKPLPKEYPPRSTRPGTIPLVRNSPESELEGFSLAGQDGRWIWAQAKIDGDTVLVWSPGVPAPAAVRYAWADNPICNLYNGAGLPASPFRTDDLPLATRDRMY